MDFNHNGLTPIIGFMVGAVGAQLVREGWKKSNKAFETLSRTQCLAVIVGCLGLFHVVASFRPDLAALESGLFWATVLIVVLFLVDPWIDPWLRRKGIRRG